MSSIDEAMSRQFREWEFRGRGGRLCDDPVTLEPPFTPFRGYRLPRQGIDDGRKPGLLAQIFSILTAPDFESEREQADELPEPLLRFEEECPELQLTLPESKPFTPSTYVAWLHQICRQTERFSFELVATDREIVPQFAGTPEAIERIDRACPQYLPGVLTLPATDALRSAWSRSEARFATVTLGLGSEFLIPLGSSKTDLLSAVVNALDGLREGELGVYQVLIEPAMNDWAENIVAAVTDSEGKPFFRNRPELFSGAERKIAAPLVATVVRFAASASNPERCWEIIFDMIAPFSALTETRSNYLIPLSNDGYDPAERECDLLDRTSHHTGMLLNAQELIPFISLPTAAASRRLRRETARTVRAPQELQQPGALLLGDNCHAGRVAEVWLSPHHRVRHTHVIGAPGMGKSSFMFNLLRQDIERGEGVALLDPHGDLVERVLGIIPAARHADVVLVDPSDEEHVVGFNILAAHSDFERNLLASDLVSIFRRLSTSWGEQMNSVLRNAVLAFLESSQGGTLADMRRFLLDAAFRKQFLRSVTDPEVVFYWERAFPQLTGNKSIGPVITRLDEFLSRKPIRYMVSQQENRLNFAEILDQSRILLVKLAEGEIGRENANLLGSVFVSKIQQIAMSRQRLRASERRDFWVYLDEFHSFITPSMAEVLTGARKYRVGLVLAHQDLHQLEADRKVASAVLNCCTRVAFRVSDRDARELAGDFGHFEPKDLQNLGERQAICRVERSEADFNLLVREAPSEEESTAAKNRELVKDASNRRYARLRFEVEAELLAKLDRRRDEQPRTEQRQADKPSEPEIGSERTATQPREVKPLDVPLSPSSEPGRPLHPTVPEAPTSPAAPSELPGGSEPTAADLPPPSLPQAEVLEVLPADPSVLGPTPADEPPRDTGKGGHIYKDAKNRITAVAHELGFLVATEAQVGRGGADLALTRGPIRIGVEVTIATGAAHEVDNIIKCLNGQFAHVASVGADLRKHDQMRERLLKRVSATDAARVGFYQVETFVEYLRSLPLPPVEEGPTAGAQPPTVTKVKGWTVKTNVNELSSEEAKAREEEMLRAIAEILRKKPK